MTTAWDCQLKLIPPLTKGENTPLRNPLCTHTHAPMYTLKLSPEPRTKRHIQALPRAYRVAHACTQAHVLNMERALFALAAGSLFSLDHKPVSRHQKSSVWLNCACLRKACVFFFFPLHHSVIILNFEITKKKTACASYKLHLKSGDKLNTAFLFFFFWVKIWWVVIKKKVNFQ